jgi:hypothetical protein
MAWIRTQQSLDLEPDLTKFESGSESWANVSETETSIKARKNLRTGIQLFNHFFESPYDSEQSKKNFLCRYR